jgi:hypothetical protein
MKAKITKELFMETLEMNEDCMGECAAFEATLQQLGICHDDLDEILGEENES